MHPQTLNRSIDKVPDAPIQTLTGVQNGTLQCLNEMQSLVEQINTVLFGHPRAAEDARVESKHSGNLEMAMDVRTRALNLRDQLGVILSGL